MPAAAPPALAINRRACLSSLGLGFGGIAFSELLKQSAPAAETVSIDRGILSTPHFAPKAKRVIYLFQSGGPSQLDLFDHKPLLVKQHGQQLPDFVRGGQRLTGMSANQSSIPLAGSPFQFAPHGQSGNVFSELLPETASIADDICIIRSLYTESINHGPGVTFMQTGHQIPGRPSLGAWLDYGLGSDNENLPAFVVLITKNKGGQPLMSHLWGSGFLPSRHQGVRFRPAADPVLYLNNPPGVTAENRRMILDGLNQLHAYEQTQIPDPEIAARIANYEMAFSMQASVPDATNFADEPESTFDLYGPTARDHGSFAANCLLARRLAERGVKFIQLYHQDWDHHGGLPSAIANECRQTDKPAAALVKDLKQRGMLDDTLVIWGGEFGRTNYCQGPMTAHNFGRDHHPRCFSIWLAGGGIKPGITWGETDDYGYNITQNPVHIHDLHATLLHLLGVDHEQLTYKFQGRRYRLTDVHGEVVQEILA